MGSRSFSQEKQSIRKGKGKGGDRAWSFVCPSHSLISLIRRRRLIEDVVRVVPRFVGMGECGMYHFFTYVGHGRDRVSNTYRDSLHMLLVKSWRIGGS